MNITILPAGEPLVEEVARRVEEAGGSFADARVVFPGKRPSHFLRRRLAQKAGTSFIPPRIHSMDEFVDCIFDAQEERIGQGAAAPGGSGRGGAPLRHPIGGAAARSAARAS